MYTYYADVYIDICFTFCIFLPLLLSLSIYLSTNTTIIMRLKMCVELFYFIFFRKKLLSNKLAI